MDVIHFNNVFYLTQYTQYMSFPYGMNEKVMRFCILYITYTYKIFSILSVRGLVYLLHQEHI